MGDAEGSFHGELVAALAEVGLDFGGEIFFNAELVGLPLVMDAGLGEGVVEAEAEVEDADEVEDGLGDDRGTARAAEGDL